MIFFLLNIFLRKERRVLDIWSVILATVNLTRCIGIETYKWNKINSQLILSRLLSYDNKLQTVLQYKLHNFKICNITIIATSILQHFQPRHWLNLAHQSLTGNLNIVAYWSDLLHNSFYPICNFEDIIIQSWPITY